MADNLPCGMSFAPYVGPTGAMGDHRNHHNHHAGSNTADQQEYSAWTEFIDYPGSPQPNATPDSDSDGPPTPELVSPTDPSPSESWTSAPTPSAPAAVAWQPRLTQTTSGHYFDNAMPDTRPMDPPNSKKRPSRTQTSLSAMIPLKRTRTGLSMIIPRKKSQRAKKNPGGFPCREGCGKVYDRDCDEKKHFERKHMEEAGWPHECLRCEKRCHYPKDVWRHLEQTHHLIVPPKEPQEIRRRLGCPCCSQHASAWLETNNAARPIDTSVVTSPTVAMEDEPTSPKTTTLWSLTQTLMSLRRLSIKAKGAEKVIMVTADKKQFAEIDVTNTNAPGPITRSIIAALKIAPDAKLSVQLYSRKSGLGPKLNGPDLMALIAKSADAEGNLKLYIEAIRPQPTMSVFTVA